MNAFKLNGSSVWNRLIQQADIMNLPEKHLKYMLTDNSRLEKYSLKAAGIFYDFSRQRIDKETMDLLVELAEFKKLTASLLTPTIRSETARPIRIITAIK